MIVRFDVWGGDDSLEHIARSHLPLSEKDSSQLLLTLLERELTDGYLVNLRAITDSEDIAGDFDVRTPDA